MLRGFRPVLGNIGNRALASPDPGTRGGDVEGGQILVSAEAVSVAAAAV
jgi:hypothetical protein